MCTVSLDLLASVLDKAKVADYEVVAHSIRIVVQTFKCHTLMQEKTSTVEVAMSKAIFLTTTSEKYKEALVTRMNEWIFKNLSNTPVTTSCGQTNGCLVQLSNPDELKVCMNRYNSTFET